MGLKYAGERIHSGNIVMNAKKALGAVSYIERLAVWIYREN
jgi:hypothetical protein